jgi:hypothetical protein
LEFESDASRLPHAVGSILSSLRTILDEAIRRFESAIADALDADARAIVERDYLDFANIIGAFAEILTEGTDDPYLPVDLLPAMAASMDRPLRDHAMLPRSVSDTSYSTRSHEKPLELVADQLPMGPPLPEALLTFPQWLTFLDIPRSFRDSMLTHVIVLGHELAHAEDQFANYDYSASVVNGLDLGREADDEVVAGLVENWVEELFADVAAVRRLGPAAIVLFGEYAGLIQVLGPSLPPTLLLQHCREHPLAELRLMVMFEELDALDYGIDFGELQPALDHWRALAARGSAAPADAPAEFTRADAIIRTAFPQIRAAAQRLIPTKVYSRVGLARALELAKILALGVAPSDRLTLDAEGRIVSTGETVEDLFTAATIVRANGAYRRQLADQIPMPDEATLSDVGREAIALRKLDELLARAVEGVRLWEDWPAQLRMA